MFFGPFASRNSLLNHLSLIRVKTTASLKYLWIGHFGQDPLSYFRAPAGAKPGAADVITFLVYQPPSHTCAWLRTRVVSISRCALDHAASQADVQTIVFTDPICACGQVKDISLRLVTHCSIGLFAVFHFCFEF